MVRWWTPFFTDLMRVHTRERNINLLIRYKCRSLVLKPLTRHYTLIPIFDPYRFLMSNQYRGAGSAIPKSIRVHGGGSSLFASAAELREQMWAEVGAGTPAFLFAVLTGDAGVHGRGCGASLKAWRASCPAPRRHGRQRHTQHVPGTSDQTEGRRGNYSRTCQARAAKALPPQAVTIRQDWIRLCECHTVNRHFSQCRRTDYVFPRKETINAQSIRFAICQCSAISFVPTRAFNLKGGLISDSLTVRCSPRTNNFAKYQLTATVIKH